ncbi:MAG: MFS transporter [Pseudonocardiaceae bacterium]
MTTSPLTRTGLVSQRWRRLIPIAFITYSLAYLDRSNYSIGAAAGLERDLHITAGTSALLGALFFLGYFLFQIPAAQYAERRSVKRLIFWCLIAWGVFASAQGVIPWVWLLMVDRFLLGVVEAAILPAMLVFLIHWFTKAERGRANTFLILGNPITVMWLSAVSGWLVEATSWQWMFILEGLPAIAWAFVFRALVTDWPADADWLDGAEKRSVLDRLAAEQAELPAVSGFREALGSRNVVILSVQYLLWSFGVYGLVFWLPSILKAASGSGIGVVGLLSAAPYALASIAMLVNSRASDRVARRRIFVWPWLLAAAVAFFLSYRFGPGHFWIAYVLLIIAGACMYAPYGPYFALIPELLPRNVAGAATGLVNSAGALGGFAGAYLVGWLNSATGGPSASFVVIAITLLIAALLILTVRPQPQTRSAVHKRNRVGDLRG